MPLYLKDNWAIMVDPAHIYLKNTTYPRENWYTLDWRHCLVLISLDGAHTPEDISRDVSDKSGMSGEDAARIVELTLKRYHQCIVEKNGASRSTPRIYRSQSPWQLSDRQRLRNSAPMKLTWVSTTHCRKSCRYCYMDARPAMIREVHHLPGESLRKIAREAADLAVSGIFITGGEPFLSDDIYDAVNSFIDNRIYVTVTTKARVDGSRLCRGAREFLNVECSLDSTDRSLVSYLTGSTASFDEAVATMKSLSRHGIPFRIKMVVGKSNAGDVPAMARLCAELGGTTLQVMEYRSHIGRYVKNFLLNDTLRDHIRQSIERSRLEYGIGIEESIGSKSVKYDGLPGSYCPEGIKSLSFLPDGTCTKCPMIPLDMNVTGGNVFKDGIYSVWNDDPGYASAVFPDKSVYAGSSCNNCETLDKCSLTGRCIVRSNVRNARYFGPDRDCPRSPPGPGCE